MFDLSGRSALVTGGSRGLGRGIAVALARQGADVAVNYRENAALAEEVVGEISAMGRQSIAIQGSTGDGRESCEAIARAALDAFGKVDILVNNAGITRDQLMLRMKRDDWDQVIATNLTSAFTCVQAVLKPMIKQRAGRIISISSVVGEMGNAGQANYAASKAGLIGFSKAVAREVASRNVTVNVVTPGLIESDMTRAITEKAQSDWASAIPLGRLGTANDVAAAVCFLASDEAAYITGQVLAVNGGMYM
ncbi:MAG TPA: 3-oxoacyl-[acyl-carrier-protein] reductase [Candidatus Limnocylindria bacterium]|nr:3-oxoacyl-[acyl-carrier-protein] reductase [Candidatus Limnocylindria bacterium]